MCGIIAGFNTQPKTKSGKKEADLGPVNDFIIDQFDNQMHRGEKGFGIIRINPETQAVELDRAVHSQKFMLDLYMKHASMIIAHHRAPTASDNIKSQTHPMAVFDQTLKFNYYVIHNGVIMNTKDLHKRHTALGFKYSTEHVEHYASYQQTKWNDSESLAIELALLIEGRQTNVQTQGSAAFIVLQMTKDGKAHRVFFGRHLNPLNMSKTRGKLRLSSEGEGNELAEDKMYSFDAKDPHMTLKSVNLSFEPYHIPSDKPKETPVASGESKSTGITTAVTSANPKDKEVDAKAKAEEDAEKKAVQDWSRDQLEEFENRIKGAKLNEIEEATQEFMDDCRNYMDDTIEEYIENCSSAHSTASTDIRSCLIPMSLYARMIREAATLAHAEVDRHVQAEGGENGMLSIMESMDRGDAIEGDADPVMAEIDIHGDAIIDETTGFKMKKHPGVNYNEKRDPADIVAESVPSPYAYEDKKEDKAPEETKGKVEFKTGKSFRQDFGDRSNNRRMGFNPRREDDDDFLEGGWA